MSREASINALVDWLIDGAPGAAGAPDVVARVGAELRAAGVPVDRMAAFVTTLHPSVLGRSFRWSPEEGISVGELPLGSFAVDTFTQSPIKDIIRGRAEIRARLDLPASQERYPVFAEFAGKGFIDYLGLPLAFTNGEVHTVTFATKAAAGFSEADIAALRRVVRPLARVGEILALRRVASTLLSTYVGRNAGDRILAGRIHRGDSETSAPSSGSRTCAGSPRCRRASPRARSSTT